MVLYLLWQRFREAGLWHADPERYFQGKYLVLNASLPPQLVDSAATSHIGTHRAALTSYVAELRDALALARALRQPLPPPLWASHELVERIVHHITRVQVHEATPAARQTLARQLVGLDDPHLFLSFNFG